MLIYQEMDGLMVICHVNAIPTIARHDTYANDGLRWYCPCVEAMRDGAVDFT